MSDSVVPMPIRQNHGNRLVHQLLSQMESTQWWSTRRLQRHQLRQLRQLLAWAKQHSEYYEGLLRHVDPQRFEYEDLLSLPLLGRKQLRQQRQQLRCRQIPAAHGRLDELMTSGSTASPVVVDITSRVAAIWSAVTLRDHLWHGRDAGLRNASARWRAENIGLAPNGLAMPDWGSPFADFYHTGPGFFLNSGSDVHDQLQWLKRVNPHYLISHPSNLRAILLTIQKQGIELPALRQLRTVGEALDPQLRSLAREILSLPLVDFYSCQEAGYIALQCPRHDHYHVQAENLIVEILDDRDRPCRPGHTGRVVVTSLCNYALPLIRYDIGDYAEAGPACDCGRGLPVIRRIQGRVRNMLRLPDGSSRWPNFGFRELMKIAAIEQFQLVQHSLDKLELKLVVATPLEQSREQAIRDTLGHYLQFPAGIELTYHDTIPRQPGGKFEDFVSHID